MKTKKTFLSLLLSAIVLTASATSPKYVFYFIGDGMGMGPAMATEMYNRQVLGNPDPLTMYQFPVVGMAMTYSASSPVTDSAAAGTALSTGVKTKNGMLGMNPDTLAVTSIAKILHDDGYGVGVLTSVAPDDATPGAFYAHVPKRSMYYEIGIQAANCDYEFLAGGDLRGMRDKEGNETDLMVQMQANGVQIVRGVDGTREISSRRVFVLNEEGGDPGNIGYAIDSIDNALTLPYLTRLCIDHLEQYSPDKFFMMVEGGSIDHALHANDGACAVKEILSFNEAIDVAVEFYKQHPLETLIVITADHDTGGMTIGNPFTGYSANLQYIDHQRISKEEFEKYCRKLLKSDTPYTWEEMRAYLADKFGFWGAVPVNERQEQKLKERFDATFTDRNAEDQRTLYFNFNAFAAEVFKVFNDVAGMGFVATSHTGNPVPVFAMGVGADEFSRLNNNIDIPTTIIKIVNKQQ